MMPAAGSPQSANPAQIAMPADPPKDHSDEHTLVDLNQQFLDNPAARVRIEK
jgi:hypothetical protein